jgi:hypothetical protein
MTMLFLRKESLERKVVYVPAYGGHYATVGTLIDYDQDQFYVRFEPPERPRTSDSKETSQKKQVKRFLKMATEDFYLLEECDVAEGTV